MSIPQGVPYTGSEFPSHRERIEIRKVSPRGAYAILSHRRDGTVVLGGFTKAPTPVKAPVVLP